MGADNSFLSYRKFDSASVAQIQRSDAASHCRVSEFYSVQSGPELFEQNGEQPRMFLRPE